MFLPSSTQSSLFESQYQMSASKRRRLEGSWAQDFRERCLPLIDENLFRPLYSDDNGAPCKSIRVVVGALVLQAMFDLTMQETQDALDFDLRWHLALGLDPSDDADYVSARTLYYFQARLAARDGAQPLFVDVTDKLLAALGTQTGLQRLDTTHLLSNFARLTRLRLFCETLRVFLRAVTRHPDHGPRVPASLRARYLKEDGKKTGYDDARASDSPRRLSVAARDAYRLQELFRGVRLPRAAAKAYHTLTRLVADQCTVVDEAPGPAPDDGDRDLPAVPVVPKAANALTADSVQTPHDPDVTYSGHKGQGYEALLTETYDPANPVQLITHASLERSCESDADRVLPAVDALAARGQAPSTLLGDTSFGSTANVVACAQRGIALIAPQPGSAPAPSPDAPASLALTDTDFQVQLVPSQPPSCCPGGVTALQTRLHTDAALGPVALLQMPTPACAACPRAGWCPALTLAGGQTVVLVVLDEYLPPRRRALEQEAAFREQYRPRAGIEGTNSELKRGHGLGRLRVRGEQRVAMAMWFRVTGCNVKRALAYWGDTRRNANKRALLRSNAPIFWKKWRFGHLI